MAKSASPDIDRALALLHAALGEFNPKHTLKRILSQVPDFGSFEWMLTIIGLEIDLRVDIPEPTADDHNQTAADFCRAVASLPRIDSDGYTLECLGLVAQALLSLEITGEGETAKGKPAKGKSEKRPVAKGNAKPGKRKVAGAERVAKPKLQPAHTRAGKSTRKAAAKTAVPSQQDTKAAAPKRKAARTKAGKKSK
jgi:hypothetical protein